MKTALLIVTMIAGSVIGATAYTRCYSPRPNPCQKPAPIERCYLRTSTSMSFCGGCHTDIRRG